MSTGVESAELIEPWIYQTLANDATLAGLVGAHIYGPIVPDELSEPYVTFQAIDLMDIVTATGATRIQVDAIYQVKVVAETTTQDVIAPIFSRVDVLLNTRNAVTSAGFLTCYRESTIAHAEVLEGQPFLHLGGRFRIKASSTP